MQVPTVLLQLGSQYTLCGRSRAGDGTAWWIPELKWQFDAGAPIHGRHPTHVWLTHTHADHVEFLPRLLHEQRTRVYVPTSRVEELEMFLEAHRVLTDAEPGDCVYELHPVAPGDRLEPGRNMVVRAVECVHRMECIGYSIWERRTQLLEHYRGMPGREIGQLKKEGVEVTSSVETPVVCILGDTTHALFGRHPELLNDHSVIVVECTYWDDADVERASENGHMHWANLRPIVDEHPSTLFALSHISLKHRLSEVDALCGDRANVHVLLPRTSEDPPCRCQLCNK